MKKQGRNSENKELQGIKGLREVTQRRQHYSLNGKQRGELQILYLIILDPKILS